MSILKENKSGWSHFSEKELLPVSIPSRSVFKIERERETIESLGVSR